MISSCDKDLNSIEEHKWKGSILVDIRYKWGFSQYEFEVNSATSILAHMNEDTIKYSFYNIAIDTIFCKYDLSQVPEWLDFAINKSICPPFGKELDTFNLKFDDINYNIPYYAPIIIQLCYKYKDISPNKMHSSFQVPVTHQFKTEYFTFTLNFPE